MKRILAATLITLLVAPPASAGQKLGKPLDWEKLKHLEAGTEIMLTVADSAPAKVKLLFADDSMLVTLRPDAPKLPKGVEELLVGVGGRWTAIFNGARSVSREQEFRESCVPTSTTKTVRVSQEGVFVGDQKVADLAQVVQQMRHGDVRGIWSAPGHLTRNILIGVAVGAAAFLIYVATHLE